MLTQSGLNKVDELNFVPGEIFYLHRKLIGEVGNINRDLENQLARIAIREIFFAV